MAMWLEHGYGGMPAKPPEVKPIITFKDLKPGLKAKAVKNTYQAQRGEIVEVTRLEGQNIYFKARMGERQLSQIEFCLYFTWPDN